MRLEYLLSGVPGWYPLREMDIINKERRYTKEEEIMGDRSLTRCSEEKETLASPVAQLVRALH